jgi:predicted transcriptional regulator
MNTQSKISNGRKAASRRGRLPGLRKIRELLNLNQVEMAAVLDVTQAMISMVESGKARAGRKLRRRISEVVDQVA